MSIIGGSPKQHDLVTSVSIGHLASRETPHSEGKWKSKYFLDPIAATNLSPRRQPRDDSYGRSTTSTYTLYWVSRIRCIAFTLLLLFPLLLSEDTTLPTNYHLHVQRRSHINADNDALRLMRFGLVQLATAADTNETTTAAAFSQTTTGASSSNTISTPPPPPLIRPFATLGLTKATLLSGGLGDCLPSPNVSACTGGLATALAAFRAHSANSFHREFIYCFDSDSAFVQMHPFDYTVNIVAMREFGIKYYFAEPSIIPNKKGRNALELFFNDDVHMLQANVDVPTTDDWSGFIHRQVILFENNIGVVLVDSSVQSISLPAADAVLAATRFLRPRVKVIVVVNHDESATGMELLSALASNPPDVFVDMLAMAHIDCHSVVAAELNSSSSTAASSAAAAAASKKTLFCGTSAGQSTANFLQLYLGNLTSNDLSTAATDTIGITSSTTGNITVRAEMITQPITALPLNDTANLLDGTYYDHQAFLAEETRKAILFDPIVGTTNVTMPSGGRWDGTYPCYAGECAQSAAYGRALMHYVPEADFAIANSGGFRGKGWPAGPIHMSHIWEMCPYANTIAAVRITGFKVWRLMELSARNFWGKATFDDVADRNLQGDGFKVEIDMSKPRFTNRLLAVWIRNRQSGAYEPLVRTQYYTVAIDNYMYEFMPDISAILQRTRYDGEVVTYPYGTDLVQTAMAQMFTATQPYDDIFAGVLVLVTDNHDSRRPVMAWTQTVKDCSVNAYWAEGIVSCLPCGEGFIQSPTHDGCVGVKPESGTTAALLVPITVPIVLGLVVIGCAVVGVLEYTRRKNTRNTSCAPKSGDGITIVFTDIQSSTKLWGTVPASMAAALETHHRVIRECIAESRGYEVKTIGDSFMIACKHVGDAMLMVVRIQERLAAQQWPSAIGEVYAIEEEEGSDCDSDADDTHSKDAVAMLGRRKSTFISKSIDDGGEVEEIQHQQPDEGLAEDDIDIDKQHNSRSRRKMLRIVARKSLDDISDEPTRFVTAAATPHRPTSSSGACAPSVEVGLRVRIGINTGVAEAVFDEVSKGYDYYGPAVNLASRIEAATQGGQILTTKATLDCIATTGKGSASPLPSLPPPPPSEGSPSPPPIPIQQHEYEHYTVSYFASAQLQGISGRTDLYQVVSSSAAALAMACRRKYDARRMRVDTSSEDVAVAAFRGVDDGDALRRHYADGGNTNNGEWGGGSSHHLFKTHANASSTIGSSSAAMRRSLHRPLRDQQHNASMRFRHVTQAHSIESEVLNFYEEDEDENGEKGLKQRGEGDDAEEEHPMSTVLVASSSVTPSLLLQQQQQGSELNTLNIVIDSNNNATAVATSFSHNTNTSGGQLSPSASLAFNHLRTCSDKQSHPHKNNSTNNNNKRKTPLSSSSPAAGVTTSSAAAAEEKERYAYVFRESVGIALGLLDERNKQHIMKALGAAWHVAAASRRRNEANNNNQQQNHHGEPRYHYSQPTQSPPSESEETMLLISQRACHALRKRLEGAVMLNASHHCHPTPRAETTAAMGGDEKKGLPAGSSSLTPSVSNSAHHHPTVAAAGRGSHGAGGLAIVPRAVYRHLPAE